MDPNNDVAAQETERKEPDSTPRGRYIPYSGGSAGWFENSGVMKSERRNNYQFEKEMNLPEVRAKQFLRWGPAFDRRKGDRKRRTVPINLLKEGSSTALTTWDINNRGIRLQYDTPPALTIGEDVSVELLDASGGKVLALLDAQVIWLEQTGTTRELWNVGLFFPFVSAEIASLLSQLLVD